MSTLLKIVTNFNNFKTKGLFSPHKPSLNTLKSDSHKLEKIIKNNHFPYDIGKSLVQFQEIHNLTINTK